MPPRERMPSRHRGDAEEIPEEKKPGFLEKQGHPQEIDAKRSFRNDHAFWKPEQLPHMVDERVLDVIREHHLSQRSYSNYYASHKESDETTFAEKVDQQRHVENANLGRHLASISFYSNDGLLRFSDHWWDNEDGEGHNIDFSSARPDDIPQMTLARYSPDDDTWHKILSLPLYQRQPWYKAESDVHLKEFISKNLRYVEQKIKEVTEEMKNVPPSSLNENGERADGYKELENVFANIFGGLGIERDTEEFLAKLERIENLLKQRHLNPFLKERLNGLKSEIESRLGCGLEDYRGKIQVHLQGKKEYKGVNSYW
ncbi:MAG: hypothetical protein WCG55_03725 [bacterium]